MLIRKHVQALRPLTRNTWRWRWEDRDRGRFRGEMRRWWRCRQDERKEPTLWKNEAGAKEWLPVTELSPPTPLKKGSQGDDPEMMWTTAVLLLLLLLPRLLHSSVRTSRCHAPQLRSGYSLNLCLKIRGLKGGTGVFGGVSHPRLQK